MFVNENKTRQNDRKGNTMAKKDNVASEVGIIGQMYENRKTKKVGVLESREEKFKTLMMRDKDGKSFNVTYSTFRSEWRKYKGEVVVQTSSQIEETVEAEQKEVESTETAIKTKSEKIKFSSDDKVKAIRYLENFVTDRIKASGANLTVMRNTRGGVIVHAKRLTTFEVWCKYGIDKYDIFFRGAIADTLDEAEFKAIADIPTVEFTEHEKWALRYKYRVDNTQLQTILDKLITICDTYVKNKEEKAKKNEKTEEE